LAQRKTILVILIPLAILLAVGTWFVWFRTPARQLPPEFIRSVQATDGKLTKVLLGTKDQVFVADASGRVYEFSFSAETANAVEQLGDGAATSLGISPKDLLLVGDDSGLLRSWQLPKLEFASIESPKVPTTCMGFRALDSKLEIFLGLSDGRIVRIANDDSEIFKTKLRGVKSMALNADQSVLAVGGTSGAITFFDASSMSEIVTLTKNHKTEVSSMKWSPDGKSICCGDWNGSISVFSATNYKLLSSGQQPDAVSQLVWIGEHVVTGSWDGQIRKWSIGRKKDMSVTAEFDTQSVIQDLAVNSVGDTIVTVAGDENVEFWTAP
jgi:WD40 repeat protein